MKKTAKKLALKTDRIVSLSASQTQQVVGGTPSAITIKTTLSSKIICL
ncbi:MAG: class I lanthipeptide [Spirosomataceae bacterium]